MSGAEATAVGHVDDGGTALMLNAARFNDRGAFAQLTRRLTPALTRAAYHLAAPPYCDDLVQETWLRAWKYRSGYRGDAQPFTWLHKIMANLAARDVTLRPTPTPRSEVDLAQMAGVDDAEGGYWFLVADSVERALAHLNRREALLIRLRYLKEASWESIQAEMGYPTVRAAQKAFAVTMRKLIALNN